MCVLMIAVTAACVIVCMHLSVCLAGCLAARLPACLSECSFDLNACYSEIKCAAVSVALAD